MNGVTEGIGYDETVAEWLKEMGVRTESAPGPYTQFYLGDKPIGYLAGSKAYFLTDFLKRTHCPWREG